MELWRVSRFQLFRGHVWWTGGTRWEEYESRECSTGGGVATRLAPAVSLHLTGYPGDLKFPGRSAQYLPIFLLVAARPAFVCSFVRLFFSGNWEWRYPRPAATWWQGEEWGRWTTRQVEPGGAEEWGGSRYFSSKRPGGIEYFQAFSQHLIWLPGRFVQWSKHWQLIVEESESVQVGLAEMKTVWGIFLLFQCHHFHFSVASFVFICGMSSVLDKGSFDLKVLVQ